MSLELFENFCSSVMELHFSILIVIAILNIIIFLGSGWLGWIVTFFIPLVSIRAIIAVLAGIGSQLLLIATGLGCFGLARLIGFG